MQVSTGAMFLTKDAALIAGVTPDDLVEISGPPDAVESVAKAVRNQRAIDRRRAKDKVARASRRANRGK